MGAARTVEHSPRPRARISVRALSAAICQVSRPAPAAMPSISAASAAPRSCVRSSVASAKSLAHVCARLEQPLVAGPAAQYPLALRVPVPAALARVRLGGADDRRGVSASARMPPSCARRAARTQPMVSQITACVPIDAARKLHSVPRREVAGDLVEGGEREPRRRRRRRRTAAAAARFPRESAHADQRRRRRAARSPPSSRRAACARRWSPGRSHPAGSPGTS